MVVLLELLLLLHLLMVVMMMTTMTEMMTRTERRMMTTINTEGQSSRIYYRVIGELTRHTLSHRIGMTVEV